MREILRMPLWASRELDTNAILDTTERWESLAPDSLIRHANSAGPLLNSFCGKRGAARFAAKRTRPYESALHLECVAKLPLTHKR